VRFDRHEHTIILTETRRPVADLAEVALSTAPYLATTDERPLMPLVMQMSQAARGR
jgi:hypothetical protein